MGHVRLLVSRATPPDDCRHRGGFLFPILSQCIDRCHDAVTVVGMETVKTPQRSIRIPDRIWHAAQEKAQARGERVSDVVRQALIKYIEKDETDG